MKDGGCPHAHVGDADYTAAKLADAPECPDGSDCRRASCLYYHPPTTEAPRGAEGAGRKDLEALLQYAAQHTHDVGGSTRGARSTRGGARPTRGGAQLASSDARSTRGGARPARSDGQQDVHNDGAEDPADAGNAEAPGGY